MVVIHASETACEIQVYKELAIGQSSFFKNLISSMLPDYMTVIAYKSRGLWIFRKLAPEH